MGHGSQTVVDFQSPGGLVKMLPDSVDLEQGLTTCVFHKFPRDANVASL